MSGDKGVEEQIIGEVVVGSAARQGQNLPQSHTEGPHVTGGGEGALGRGGK